MNIRRIDGNIIECFISADELAELEISSVDFIEQSDKAHDFVESVVDEAVKEVGFKESHRRFMNMTIIQNPAGMIIYLLENISTGQMKSMIEKLNQHAKKSFQEYTKTNIEKMIDFSEQADLEEGTQGDTSGTASEDFSEDVSDEIVKLPNMLYFFTTIGEVITLAAFLPDSPETESSLYKYRNEICLFLEMVNKTDVANREYFATCVMATEFGGRCVMEKSKHLEVKEYGECLIPDKALTLLKG